MKDGTSIPSETVFTSLQFQQAMTRRAIAYDFAQLMSFDISRRYCDMLLKHLNREPPPGYSATSLSQLIKADQQVWAKLSEAGSDIRRNNAGEYPLDRLIIQTLESYEISFYLLPMVASSANANWNAAPRQGPYEEFVKGKGKGKHKGKRKTKGEHVQTWVPPKLRGGKPTNPAGNPSCFNYNLEGCDAAQAGSACPIEDFTFVASASRIIRSLGTMALRRKRINPDSQDLRLWNTNQCMRPLSSKYSRAQAVSQHGCERLE